MSKSRFSASKKATLVAGLSAFALLAATAAAAEPARPIHIPAGPLDAALLALAAQTDQQLLFPHDLVARRHAPAIDGTFTTEGALQRLLARSNITVTRAGPGVLVLRSRVALTSTGTPSEAPGAAGAQAPRPFGANPAPADPAGAPTSATPVVTARPPPSTTVAELEVTGSHIRGTDPGASPLLVLDHEALDRSGRATVAEVLNLLPQNFSGEDTEGSVNTRAATLGSNLNYATGVNLRGLGDKATLVLLNGRRLGGAGVHSDFTDLTTIPTIAVDRVEILLDGASAIYGSDAVAGVVNVILKTNLEGGEFRIRGGTSTDGGASEGQAGMALGHTWSGGGALIAYEGTLRGRLSADARRYTASADLRPFGGSDFRLTNAFPGNVIAVDPATGVRGPYYGIPAGQTGAGLTPDAFLPGAINRTSPQAGLDILPDQRSQSLYAALHQDLTDQLQVSADLHYGHRTARARSASTTSTFTVTRANPFFVSPNGTNSNQIQYDFTGELPAPITGGTADSLSATAGGRLRLFGDWAAHGYLGFAREKDVNFVTGLVNSALLAEALGNVPDNPATAYSPAVDGYFNPYTGVAANPRAVTQAIGSGFSLSHVQSTLATGDLQADGTLFTLPGGPVKLAIGGNQRREIFLTQGTNFFSTPTPVPQLTLKGRRSVTAAFAEARLPLVGPDNALPLVQALEVSAAVRHERYSDFGQTTNPKFGILWRPLEGVALRATYGRSFRAPTLEDIELPQIFTVLNFPVGATRVQSLALQGGNRNLKPETATSWTLGADMTPAFAPGLRLSVNWFDVAFTDRIDRPVLQNLINALVDPRFAAFVRRIQPDSNAADLALITSLLNDPAAGGVSGLNPPNTYRAIVDLRVVNTSELHVKGLDVEAAYRVDALGGRVDIAANISRLFSYAQALTPSSSSQELLGLVGLPAKLRGRASADWTRGSVGLGAAVNYLDGARDSTGRRVKAQATVDLQARLAARDERRFAGTTLSLQVRNVFDTDPPFYNNPFGFAYDPANAEPIGRFVALQLARRW